MVAAHHPRPGLRRLAATWPSLECEKSALPCSHHCHGATQLGPKRRQGGEEKGCPPLTMGDHVIRITSIVLIMLVIVLIMSSASFSSSFALS